MVDAYSVSGFSLNNGMKVFGPMILFPNAVLSWRIQVDLRSMSKTVEIRILVRFSHDKSSSLVVSIDLFSIQKVIFRTHKSIFLIYCFLFVMS